MNEWGIVVCTYGNSEQRLVKTLESLKGDAVPYDLYVRGAVKDYQQELTHYAICDRFGATYLESGRWRYYEPARIIRRVKNPMIAILKDDIVMGKNWLTAMDWFWKHNEKIGSVGWNLIEAWELVNARIWQVEDDFWTKPMPDLNRGQLAMLCQSQSKTMNDPRLSDDDMPTFTDAPLPVAWTLKRSDFEAMDGYRMVGPGDNSCMYADLCWPSGLRCVNLGAPIVYHRKQTSTREYLASNNITSLGQDTMIWISGPLHDEYVKRWSDPFWLRRVKTWQGFVFPANGTGDRQKLEWYGKPKAKEAPIESVRSD